MAAVETAVELARSREEGEQLEPVGPHTAKAAEHSTQMEAMIEERERLKGLIDQLDLQEQRERVEEISAHPGKRSDSGGALSKPVATGKKRVEARAKLANLDREIAARGQALAFESHQAGFEQRAAATKAAAELRKSGHAALERFCAKVLGLFGDWDELSAAWEAHSEHAASVRASGVLDGASGEEMRSWDAVARPAGGKVPADLFVAVETVYRTVTDASTRVPGAEGGNRGVVGDWGDFLPVMPVNVGVTLADHNVERITSVPLHP
jgi:hypothetical protein